MFNGKIHYKWPFSIAMLNYQRVPKHIHWMQENTPSLGHSQSDQGPLSTILRTRTFYAPRSKTSKTAMFGKSSSQPPITPMSFPYFSGDRWLFRLFEARQLRHVDAIDIGRRHIRLPSCTTEAAAAQVHRLEAEDSMGQAERMTSEVALVRCIATEKQQKYHIRYKSIYCTCVIMY